MTHCETYRHCRAMTRNTKHDLSDGLRWLSAVCEENELPRPTPCRLIDNPDFQCGCTDTTPTPPMTDDLVGRLKFHGRPLYSEAAARIEALEAALRPFAEIAHGEVYDRFKADSRLTFRISNGGGDRHLTFINAECFDAARAALTPEAPHAD